MSISRKANKALDEDRVERLVMRHLEGLAPENLGFGHDPYTGEKKLRFPMALGLYLRSFLRMRTWSGCERQLNELISASITHLDRTRGEDGAWGLPFAWKDLPSGAPMTITTAIAAGALLEINQTASEDLLTNACDWLCDGIQWAEGKAGACPWFADGWPLLATNVACRTAGTLIHAGQHIGKPRYTLRATQAARYVCSEQDRAGFWVYGKPNERALRSAEVIDNKHTGYILEGLLQILECRRGSPWGLTRAIKASIRRGVRSMNALFFPGDGMIREKLWRVSREQEQVMYARASATREWTSQQLRRGLRLVAHPVEPRLWSLGEALVVHSMAAATGLGAIDNWQDVLRRIESLATDNGHFRYRMNEGSVYVRHEAHVFAGLVELRGLIGQSGGRHVLRQE